MLDANKEKGEGDYWACERSEGAAEIKVPFPSHVARMPYSPSAFPFPVPVMEAMTDAAVKSFQYCWLMDVFAVSAGDLSDKFIVD